MIRQISLVSLDDGEMMEQVEEEVAVFATNLLRVNLADAIADLAKESRVSVNGVAAIPLTLKLDLRVVRRDEFRISGKMSWQRQAKVERKADETHVKPRQPSLFDVDTTPSPTTGDEPLGLPGKPARLAENVGQVRACEATSGCP